jgi:hypothetical protein
MTQLKSNSFQKTEIPGKSTVKTENLANNDVCNYSKEHSVESCCMMKVITGSRSRIMNNS